MEMTGEGIRKAYSAKSSTTIKMNRQASDAQKLAILAKLLAIEIISNTEFHTLERELMKEK